MNILQQAPISSYLAPGASAQQAEARDGGGHHGHHAGHSHDEHHHVEHAAAAPVSICTKYFSEFSSNRSKNSYCWQIELWQIFPRQMSQNTSQRWLQLPQNQPTRRQCPRATSTTITTQFRFSHHQRS